MLKKITTYLLFLFVFLVEVGYCHAQNQAKRDLDSINRLIKFEKSDTLRFQHLQAAFLHAMNHSDGKLESKYLGMMKSELKKHKWKKGDILYHHANAIYLFYKNDFDGSLRENLLSLKLAKESNEISCQARSYGNIALVYYVRSDYITSLKYDFKGLEIEKKLKNKTGIADSYNNIGIIYENLGQFKKALWYQQKSIKLRTELKDLVGLHKNYSNIGNIYYSLLKYDSSLLCYEKSLKLAIQIEDENAIGSATANIANIFHSNKDYKQAIVFSRRALNLFSKVGNDRGWVASAGNLGENFFQLNNMDSARYFSTMAVDRAKKLGMLDMEITCSKALIKVYEKVKDFEGAFIVLQRITQLKDSISGEEKKLEIARFELKHEYAVKEERRKAKAILEKRRQDIILYAVIFGLIGSLLFGFLVLRNLKNNKKKNKIIEEQKIVVEAKQKEIIDSIHYAKRIQEAILPSKIYIGKNLKRMFKKE